MVSWNRGPLEIQDMADDAAELLSARVETAACRASGPWRLFSLIALTPMLMKTPSWRGTKSRSGFRCGFR